MRLPRAWGQYSTVVVDLGLIPFTEFITLDGVIDSPGGGDHPRAGWTFKEVDFVEDAYEIKGREEIEAGALLIGRVSYDEFAPIWPKMDEFAEYNEMPKYVVSTTLSDPDWNNTSVLRSIDDVARRDIRSVVRPTTNAVATSGA